MALEAVARAPSASTSTLAELLDEEANRPGPFTPWITRAVALRADIDAAKLDVLGEHVSPVVRHAVALNGSTPTARIEQLARDSDWAVRLSVAALKRNCRSMCSNGSRATRTTRCAP